MRKYLISILFILLMCVSLGLIIAPADIESISSENREIKTFPTFSVSAALSGQFSKDFEDYVDDNIACRGMLMNISDKIKSRIGYTPNGIGRIIETTSDIGTGESNEGRLVIYD